MGIITSVPPRQVVAAEDRFKDNVFTVAKSGEIVLLEYLPKTSSVEPAAMAYQKDDGKFLVWHDCPARKSGFAYACWHLGLIGVLEGIQSSFEVEIVSADLPTISVQQDLSQQHLNHPGEFRVLKFEPEAAPAVFSPPLDSAFFPESGDKLSLYGFPEITAIELIKHREMQMKRLSPEQKARISPWPEYYPQGQEVITMINALVGYKVFGNNSWDPVILIGPKSLGKSTLAHLASALTCQPINVVSGNKNIDDEVLTGSKTLTSTEENKALVAEFAVMRAKMGKPLTPDEVRSLQGNGQILVHQAGVIMDAAVNGEIVFLDEVNSIDAGVLSSLNTMLDWQRILYIPGVGQVKAHPDFRVIAACNENYAGTGEMSESFISRHGVIRFKNICNAEIVEKILRKELGPVSIDDSHMKKLVAVYSDLYNAVYSEDATLGEDCLCIRSLTRAAKEIALDPNGVVSPIREKVVSRLSDAISSPLQRDIVSDLVQMKF